MELIEEWKDIVGHEGWYQVSNMGNIRSVDRLTNSCNIKSQVKTFGKLLKPKKSSNGYKTIQLYKNSCFTNNRIHRLVAQSFIENPFCKKDVNHINGIKTDNRACNLEWATRSENIQHAWDNKLRHPVKPMLGKLGELNHTSKALTQYTSDGTQIKSFGSIREASRHTGLPISSIGQCANGRLKKAGSFIFKFNN